MVLPIGAVPSHLFARVFECLQKNSVVELKKIHDIGSAGLGIDLFPQHMSSAIRLAPKHLVEHRPSQISLRQSQN